MYDCAIVGSGPAGISAALTLKARNKNFIWFGSSSLSLKVEKAEKISNYPGLINVSGEEMQKIFSLQIQEAGITITEKTITGVYQMGDYYSLLANQEMFEARTVILTTGVSSLKEVEGETENLGRGVSYCATCDGFLYKNKIIGIVEQDASFDEEVAFLSDIASKVYLIPLYQNPSFSDEKISVLHTRPKKIKKVNKKIVMVTSEGEIELDGIFFLKSAVAPSVLVPGIETEGNHIRVTRKQETSLKGVYAAGDCTGTPYQYAKAVGEGNVAAHEVVRYLSK